MRKSTEWYKITYTRYIHWEEIPNVMNPYTTWVIEDYYTKSIRKAKNFLKEHKDGRLTIVLR